MRLHCLFRHRNGCALIIVKQTAADLNCRNLIYQPERKRAQFCCAYMPKRAAFFLTHTASGKLSTAPVCILFVTHYRPPKLEFKAIGQNCASTFNRNIKALFATKLFCLVTAVHCTELETSKEHVLNGYSRSSCRCQCLRMRAL